MRLDDRTTDGQAHQRRKPDRHGDDTEPVAVEQHRQPHRLCFQGKIEHADHNRARHDVDIEDVFPAPVLGEVTADGRLLGPRLKRYVGWLELWTFTWP